ncbi:MAG: nitroreductase family deazaflavin-dependent oxidoreductase [Chloroflexi bacterium]|nr:nitroreductase family deazaflavin-dependent oxidoreductase [Chloroflexota bacterium]
MSEKFITERIPYPSGALMKYLFKLPILFYRMGLGPLVGQMFMVMTTTGRKSGLPRRTAIEFHQYNGRKYVMIGWQDSDWYKNIQANPYITIQTASGTERVYARRLTEDAEYAEAWDFAESSPFMQVVMRLTGTSLTRESFLAQKDRFGLMTFDPTDRPTPPPLENDLAWVWWGIGGLVLAAAALGLLRRRRAGGAPPAG